MVRTKQTAKRITGEEGDQKEDQHNELGVIATGEGEPAAAAAEADRKPAKLRKAAARKKATATEEVDGVKKPRKRRRAKPGVKAIREIRDCQKSTKLLLRKLPFSRLVREVAQVINGPENDLRFTKESISTLQEASEDYLVRMFRDAGRIAIGNKKKTLQLPQMRMARRNGIDTMSPTFMDPVVNLELMAENGFQKKSQE